MKEEKASSLSSEFCVPCRKGSARLSEEEQKTLFSALDGWSLLSRPPSYSQTSDQSIELNATREAPRSPSHRLEKSYSFKNYKRALEWVNALSLIAEQENHHPEIELGWGRVKLALWTHTIEGLHRNDFVLAAKLDEEFGKFLKAEPLGN